MQFQKNPNIQIALVEGETEHYICCVDYVKTKRNYLIRRPVYEVIEFCSKPRKKDEIKCFSIQYGAVKDSQFDDFFSDFLLKKGIVRDISNNKEFTLKSSVLNIKFRLFSPKLVNFLVKPLMSLFSLNMVITSMLFFLASLIHIAAFIYNEDFAYLSATLSWHDSIAVIALIGVGLIFHELGHAAAAYLYGCRKVEIGIGWYIYFVVFYAELSEAWRLKPEKRLIIDCAGGYFQSIFGTVLWLVFLYTEQFIFMSAAALLALYSLFNLNPFFRMDGYWIVSDLLKVTNLRAIAFCIIKSFFTAPLQFFREMKTNIGDVSRAVFMYAMTMLLFYIWFSYYVYFSLFPRAITIFYNIFITAFSHELNVAEFTISFAQLLWNGLIIYFVIYFSISTIKQIANTLRNKYRAL